MDHAMDSVLGDDGLGYVKILGLLLAATLMIYVCRALFSAMSYLMVILMLPLRALLISIKCTLYIINLILYTMLSVCYYSCKTMLLIMALPFKICRRFRRKNDRSSLGDRDRDCLVAEP